MDFINDPRHQMHYALAHQVIPDLVEEHGSDLILRLMADGAGFLEQGWKRLAEDGGFDAGLRDQDFSVVGPAQNQELCVMSDRDQRWAVLFLTMPEVRAPLESEIGTFVWDVTAGIVRYFTLEVEMNFDGSVGPGRVLCEWKDGNHLNYGSLQVGTLEQLRDAVFKVLAT